MRGFIKNATMLGAAGLAVGVGIGVGEGLLPRHGAGRGGRTLGTGVILPASPAEADSTLPAGRSSDEQDTIRVVKSVSPAVVTITDGQGLGSGVIIDGKNGIILTNNHVIAGAPARQVDVTFKNAKTVRGQVLGTDPEVDIAVVKVNTSGLPQAALADSDKIEVGQTAIAIGAPLGLEQTVTHGIVSTLNRKIDANQVEGYIQTDAAINPGNSGGPLLDSSGRVIGINSAVLRGNEAQSLGFAVPINVARDVARQVLSGGSLRRAFLPIDPVSITPDIANQFNLPVRSGVMVGRIAPDLLQTSAPLYPGDLITAIDKQTVSGVGDLLRIVRGKKPGDTITLTVLRRNGATDIKARLLGR